MNQIIFFIVSFFLSSLIADEQRPLTLKPFDVNSSGFTYGRGVYLIVLPDVSIETYLTNENYGGDFVRFKKTQGYDVEIMYYNQIATNEQELKNSIMEFHEQHLVMLQETSFDF